jgi:hypothetical protein
MADKRTEQTATPAPAAPVLGHAGESTDPLVHQLLAERLTAFSNGDGDGVKAADAALAELGVSVG